MSFFQKKLSIKEMWKLYQLIEPKNSKAENYLIDELMRLLRNSSDRFEMAMKLLHPDLNIKAIDPMTVSLKFSQGLVHNKFFTFRTFIESFIRGK